MSDRAAAIIIQANSLLLIHRWKNGREYYVFPGGDVEEGESAEQACIREVKEETSLESVAAKYAFDFDNNGRQEHYFFIQVLPGPLILGEPEKTYQSETNIYIPEWVLLSNLENLNILPRPALQLLQARLDSSNL